MVVLSNIRGVNLKSFPPSPIIIRHVVDATLDVWREKDGKSFRWAKPDLIWFPHGMSSLVKNFSTIKRKGRKSPTEHHCPLSRYFTPAIIGYYSGRLSGYCVALSMKEFAVAIKSWRCQVEVNLLMPDYLLSLENELKYSEHLTFITVRKIGLN